MGFFQGVNSVWHHKLWTVNFSSKDKCMESSKLLKQPAKRASGDVTLLFPSLQSDNPLNPLSVNAAGLCFTAEWSFNGATQKVSGDKSHTPAEAQHFGFLLSPRRLERGLHHTLLLHLPGTPKAASPWEVT